MSTGVGLRIKNRRIELGLSQEELAMRLHLKSKSTICKVERGDDNLTTDTIQKYAEALYTTPASLLGWENVKFDPVSGYPIFEDDLTVTVDLKDVPAPSQAEIEKAMDLYRRMKSLPPEMQTALLNLLDAAQTDT